MFRDLPQASESRLEDDLDAVDVQGLVALQFEFEGAGYVPPAAHEFDSFHHRNEQLLRLSMPAQDDPGYAGSLLRRVDELRRVGEDGRPTRADDDVIVRGRRQVIGRGR